MLNDKFIDTYLLVLIVLVFAFGIGILIQAAQGNRKL